MINQFSHSENKKWLFEQRAKVAVTNLKRVNMNAEYVSTQQEALSVVLEMIPAGATVVCADSVTLDQVGIIRELRSRNQNKVLDPYEEDASGAWVVEYEQSQIMRREAFLSDVFLSGTNAVTLDGKLVNVDGHGNRVAAMAFGPKKVIIVAGVNKIVKDVNEALERIRVLAAPMNARRHYMKNHIPIAQFGDLPCVRTGKCHDCNNDWRTCRYTMIIEGAISRDKGRINVVLIGEELGI